MPSIMHAARPAAATVLIATTAASADKIAMYKFAEAGTDLSATTYDHPVTAANMTLGAGLSQATGHFGNRLGLDTFLSTGETTAIADAVANDSFIEFAATSDSGWAIDLGKVQFRLSGYDPEGEVVPPSVAWSLRTSIDGFSSDVDTGTNSAEYQEYEVVKAKFASLGLAADNLSNVSFRLYFSHWGTSAPTGVVVDQISLFGQTVVVVPGSGGLIALTGAGLVRGRRRR